MRNFIDLKLLLFFIIDALNEESANNMEFGNREIYIPRNLETKSVIKVTYKEAASYPNGFANDFRTGIDSIVVDGTTYGPNAELNIKDGQTIEIIFSESNPPKSLRLFFGYVEEWEFGDKNSQLIFLILMIPKLQILIICFLAARPLKKLISKTFKLKELEI